MEASRDDNRIATLLGVNPSGVVTALKVDNVTGRLLVAIKKTTTVLPTDTEFTRDGNRVPVAIAVDNSNNPQEIKADNRNGYLWANVTIE